MKRTAILGLAAAAAALLATAAVAADEPAKVWTDAAELGVVMTSGNAEGTNFALANKFKYTWSNAELLFDASAQHADARTRTIDDSTGSVVVTDTTNTTASNYLLALKYRRNIGERFYWYVAASWYQNFFGGIDDRYLAGGGVGYTFVKTPRHILKGELGFDGTREDPLGNAPPVEFETKDYFAARGYLGYEFAISEKSKLTEDLNLFENLDDTSAWRVSSVTSVTAGFTDKLALKVSAAVLYTNVPPFKLAQPNGTPYQLGKTDSILSAALVVNF